MWNPWVQRADCTAPFYRGTWAPVDLFSRGCPGPSPPQTLRMTVPLFKWLLTCLLFPCPWALLPPPFSFLTFALAWSSPRFPRVYRGTVSSETSDHVVPGGAQGSVQGGHSGPAPAPPGRGHASLWGSRILWRHPLLREWAVPQAGHQHPGPRQDQVRAVKTLGEEGAGSTRQALEMPQQWAFSRASWSREEHSNLC